MKVQNFLWLLFIPVFTNELASQLTINETSTWKQYFEYGNNGCFCIEIKDQLYQINGDTLIGNHNYFNVLVTGVKTTIYQHPSSTVIKDIHYYAHPIREENNALYAFNPSKNEEYLLYDFNLDIGDHIGWTPCNTDTVVSIDTIFFGNIPLQRFHIRGSSSDLVEGIGSTRGLYEQPCFGIPPAIAYLQCYCQNGNCISFSSIHEPHPDCDSLTTAIPIIEFANFSVYPNPFDNEIQIQSTIPLDKDATINILNLTSDIMMKKKIQFNTFSESVNVASLPPGIYFIGIQNKEVISFKKMVKL